jgi:hypothetical protein
VADTGATVTLTAVEVVPPLLLSTLSLLPPPPPPQAARVRQNRSATRFR